MDKNRIKYPDTLAYRSVVESLNSRGISIEDIAKITFDNQSSYVEGLTMGMAISSVDRVMHKREVLNNAMVGFALDDMANEGKLPEPLQTIVSNDIGVFGTDELLAVGISFLSGMIGVTNFGYIDKIKQGIIKELDTRNNEVTTFSDDIVGAIASEAGARLAHKDA
ncbi:phosphatidylglycerophosphatase A [Streptomyces sp. TRM76323]|uniref:Phosphatidylglycerophosphatase A n=1 Tax=Streptomyces tamarix TaxID=3078565 RepID=A0ABU3QKS0_9ACTN|nr:phosphatidylglycerophosphatase A [Streptomyces tamarix]MDT9683361.1 phosphatidylglycerophosphatase A [Streptomyces tamarix]